MLFSRAKAKNMRNTRYFLAVPLPRRRRFVASRSFGWPPLTTSRFHSRNYHFVWADVGSFGQDMLLMGFSLWGTSTFTFRVKDVISARVTFLVMLVMVMTVAFWQVSVISTADSI